MVSLRNLLSFARVRPKSPTRCYEPGVVRAGETTLMGPRLTLLEAPKGTEENCYIDSPLGVVSVLRTVAASAARVAAYFDNDRRCLETRLLAVDGEPPMLVFEKSPDDVLNAALLRAERVTFVTSDHGVPVQFSCRAALRPYQGRDTLQAPLPARLLRLQRRGYYRLPGEPTHALLRCELARGFDGETLKALVFDLSCGGLSAAVPAAEPVLERKAVHGCMLELPGEGRIHSPVLIRLVTKIMLPSGLQGTRYGLKFVSLDQKQEMALQRYILNGQRARNGLLSGGHAA
jgi:flagellar brake protein